MRRSLLLLLLFAPTLLAGGRDEFVAARKTLESAYFDRLDADQRDRLFEALGGWDHPEVVPALAEAASLFGTYLDGIESRMAANQEKLSKYTGRVALRDVEIGLRNSYIRKLEKLEFEWRRARASEDLLVKLVGAYREPKTIRVCLTTLARHPTGRVRQLLARATAHWHAGLKDAAQSKKLIAVLRQLGHDKDAGVRVAVARAAAAFKRKEGLDLLEAALKDSDWRVRGAAVASLAQTRTSEAAGLLIAAMGREEGRLKDDINKILVKWTGEKFEYAESWSRWWVSNARQLPERPRAPDGGPSAEAKPKRKPKADARFYGIRTRSDRICFIIDVSGSMKKKVPPIRRVVITGRKEQRIPAEGKTRIEVAKNELKRAVSNLSPDTRFLIIFFNHAVRKWRPELTKATPATKKAVRTDLDAVRASGATYTLGALREAFAAAGVLRRKGTTQRDGAGIDTIFLLSDGGPTTNKLEDPQPMDPDPILDQVREWNRDAGIVIHTIAVDTDETGDYFLRQLAAQNGGVFVERK